MRTTAFALPALCALMLTVTPAAQACHAGIGLREAQGLVVLEGAPALASIRFGRCEGPTQVTITLEATGGLRTFEAVLDIVAPKVACLTEGGCSPVLPPAAAFTLRSDAEGLLLVGLFQNAGHFAFTTQLAGTYLGAPAAFASAVA